MISLGGALHFLFAVLHNIYASVDFVLPVKITIIVVMICR